MGGFPNATGFAGMPYASGLRYMLWGNASSMGRHNVTELFMDGIVRGVWSGAPVMWGWKNGTWTSTVMTGTGMKFPNACIVAVLLEPTENRWYVAFYANPSDASTHPPGWPSVADNG